MYLMSRFLFSRLLPASPIFSCNAELSENNINPHGEQQHRCDKSCTQPQVPHVHPLAGPAAWWSAAGSCKKAKGFAAFSQQPDNFAACGLVGVQKNSCCPRRDSAGGTLWLAPCTCGSAGTSHAPLVRGESKSHLKVWVGAEHTAQVHDAQLSCLSCEISACQRKTEKKANINLGRQQVSSSGIT